MDASKKTIFFRADGDSKIGLGHIIRSYAMASAIKNEYNCLMATRCTIQGVLEELNTVFNEVISLPETEYDLEAQRVGAMAGNSNLVILDGYAFDSKYQEILTGMGHDLFCIDDIHAFRFFSKVIINQSGGLSPLDYKAQPATQFYLGPHYSLLRHPFLDAAKKRRTVIDNNTCFVCFGGADPKNKTLEVLRNPAISNYFDHFYVVIGNAYMHSSELMEFSGSRKNISLYQSLTAEKIVSVMQKCSFAICSPSTVVYEYMSVGGIVFLEQIADNQKDVIRYMVKEGLAFHLMDIEKNIENKIEQCLQKQAVYFDGRSDERFRKLFSQYFESRRLFIRRAAISDLETCFNWANDQEVRAQSYHQNPISLSEHTVWFTAKLTDQNSFFYILELDHQPVAQVRFQVIAEEAVLGYLADKSIRNKGLGTSILGKGIEQFVHDYKKRIQLVGYVKRSNPASQCSFERLAFMKMDTAEYPDSFKYIMHHDN